MIKEIVLSKRGFLLTKIFNVGVIRVKWNNKSIKKEHNI
ncbi:hypothetical protein FM106_31780 [Brachybacterium faecium]|nr:hypothetical protein FM106_31780 [Brachybacterium faecium]